jgi:eukaryotic-like serine/threonine-protein kinase
MGKPQFSLTEGQWIEGTPYRVVRPLGLGGMGEVYEVDHTRTGTRRAIKVLRDSSEATGNSARRLLREGRALAAIDHPNVVRVYEMGTIADGRPYFAMQLLEGTTFRGLLSRDEAIGTARALRLVLQALSGLGAVHDFGIVHRDLKPTNLFLCRGECVKVLDFGVAKLLDGTMSSLSTAEGMVLGTMRYMAPEQLSGGPVTTATDVYAMGLVLFELLARRHAFQTGKGGDGQAMARLKGVAPLISSVVSRPLPRGLEEVLACALQREASKRFADAGEFADELRGCLQEVPEAPVLQPAAASASLRWEGAIDEEPTVRRPQAGLLRREPPSAANALAWRVGMASSIGALVLASVAAAVAIAGAAGRTVPWPGGVPAARGHFAAAPP